MTVITMTREMGTRGKDVARGVAEALGLTIVHHELLGPGDPQPPETGPSEVARLIDSGPEAEAYWQKTMPFAGYLTPAEVIALALRGNVLIRGWGATKLLRGVPHVLSVRICAPLGVRIAEMMRRLGCGEARARREIERSDAGHTRLVDRLFGLDWRKRELYDIELDTGDLSVESCIATVIDAARSTTLEETEASRQLLCDRLIDARIDHALHDGGPLGRRAANVGGNASSGRVRLWGAVTDGGASSAIEAVVRDLPDVTAVDNDICRIGRYADG